MLATLLAISGPLSFVRRFLRTWGIWLLLGGRGWLTWNLLAKHDLAALMRRPGTGEMSFGGAIDLVVAMPLSWLPLIADYTRFGRRPGETFRGTLLGYGIANIWFYALGAIYGLAAGGGDALLTGALAQAGGGLALLLILIDEIDNAFADIHSAAVSTGTFWTRGSVPLLSAAFGALCTLIALLVPMAQVSELPAADRLGVRAAVRRGAGGSLHRAQAPHRSRRARRRARPLWLLGRLASERVRRVGDRHRGVSGDQSMAAESRRDVAVAGDRRGVLSGVRVGAQDGLRLSVLT